MTMSRFVMSFRTIPKDLFRINNGPAVSLRGRTARGPGLYDILTESGNVKPKALNPDTYESPNGASMRPNTPKQTELVKRYKNKNVNGKSVIVYAVPAGTQLPDNLILVHERGDHYSLQPATEMSLEELNSSITTFLMTKGSSLTQAEWLKKYPTPTETS